MEYEGETITPKQFTVMAAKDKQKDWKGAIKINRQPLRYSARSFEACLELSIIFFRVLFEKQLLDFYKHPEFCSGRCVSKNNRIWVPDGQDSSPTTSALSHDFNKDLLSQSYRRQSPNDSNGNGVYDSESKIDVGSHTHSGFCRFQ